MAESVLRTCTVPIACSPVDNTKNKFIPLVQFKPLSTLYSHDTASDVREIMTVPSVPPLVGNVTFGYPGAVISMTISLLLLVADEILST